MAEPLAFDLDYIRQIMAANEMAYRELGNSKELEEPELDPTTSVYRHKVKDDRQIVYLKGIRYLSLLNASAALFINGFFVEMGILMRCMDETLEDAIFFTVPSGKDGQLSARQVTAMEEFYQEEFEDPSVGMLQSKPRQRVPRAKIRADIAASPFNEVNRHDTAHVHATVYGAISGYVHGAYPHIMELYLGPNSGRYSTRGMSGTRREMEAERQVVHYVYRGILMGQCAAMKLGRPDVCSKFVQIRDAIETRWPHLAADPHTGLAALKKKR